MNCSRVCFLAGLLLIPAGSGCGKKDASGGSGPTTSGPGKEKLVGAWLLEKTETDGEAGKTIWEFDYDGGAPEKSKAKLKAVFRNELILGEEDGSNLAYQRQGPAATGKSKAEKLIGRWFRKGNDSPREDVYYVFTKDGKVAIGTPITIDGSKVVDRVNVEGTFKVKGDTINFVVQSRGRLLIKNHSDPNRSTGYPTYVSWQLKGDKLLLEPYRHEGLNRVVDASEYTIKLESADHLVLVDSSGKKKEFKKQPGDSKAK
jgi:hypothetical protein